MQFIHSTDKIWYITAWSSLLPSLPYLLYSDSELVLYTYYHNRRVHTRVILHCVCGAVIYNIYNIATIGSVSSLPTLRGFSISWQLPRQYNYSSYAAGVMTSQMRSIWDRGKGALVTEIIYHDPWPVEGHVTPSSHSIWIWYNNIYFHGSCLYTNSSAASW